MEVEALVNSLGRYEVTVHHTGCKGSGNCVSIIDKAVSSVAGRKMAADNSGCSRRKSDVCTLKLYEEDNFKVTTGVCRLVKHGSAVSGDSFTFLNTGEGKYIVAICDGMGSGYKAAAQSRMTISLLENFLESGFDQDMAVSIINSVLALKLGDDSFSTVDISAIDLFTGDVEFVKTGAAPTYIRNGERVEIIKTASLPAGILGDVDTELMRRRVEEGSMLIMVSDGVVDSFAGERSGDRELLSFIRSIKSNNPQEVAEEILKKAEKNYHGEPQDDMTVIVSKVWRYI